MSGFLRGIQNLWTGYSASYEQYCEKKLIQEWSAIPFSNIKIEDITISSLKDDTIHCISVVTGDKIPYVLLPGFAASGAMYYKLIKDLSSKYNLYLVDMRGMGCSGRPKFPATTQEEAEKYLLEGLETWRQKMGIEKMILSGHSFGGYVASKYTAKFPERIISLVLISPAGIWPTPINIEEEIEIMIKEFGYVQRNVFKKVSAYWTPGKTPLQLLRRLGRVAILGLGRYVSMFKDLQEDEKLDLKEYMFQILMKPGTGELALGYLLEKGAYGVDSSDKYLNALRLPVSIFFGEKDWMASRTPSDAHLENSWIKQKTIKEAGHHIYFDNTKDLLEGILQNLAEITN